MNNEKLLTDGPAEGTATSFTRYQIKYVSPEYTEAIAKKGIALTNPNPTVEVNEFFVENVEKRVDTKRHCWGESVDEYELCEAVIAEYQAVKDSLTTRPVEPAAPVVQREEDETCFDCDEYIAFHQNGGIHPIGKDPYDPSQPTPVVVRPEEDEDNFTTAARFAGISFSQGCQFHLMMQHLLGNGPAPGFLLSAQPAPLPSDAKQPPFPLVSDEWLDRLAPGVLIAGRVQSAHMAQELQQWRKYGSTAAPLPVVQKETK